MKHDFICCRPNDSLHHISLVEKYHVENVAFLRNAENIFICSTQTILKIREIFLIFSLSQKKYRLLLKMQKWFLTIFWNFLAFFNWHWLWLKVSNYVYFVLYTILYFLRRCLMIDLLAFKLQTNWKDITIPWISNFMGIFYYSNFSLKL